MERRVSNGGGRGVGKEREIGEGVRSEEGDR